MKTILIPIDFSEGTLMTCKYAIHLAGKEQTKLFLFHIYPDQLMIPDSSFPAAIDSDAFLNTEFIMELRQQAEKNMLGFIVQLQGYLKDKKLQNIELDHYVTGGDPEWEINEICERIDPAYILMGTRGEGNKGFLEGSMAEKIMIKAHVPVIAVPYSVDQLRLKNIMYACNFSTYDYKRMQSMVGIFKNVEREFFVIHFELKGKQAEDNPMMAALEQAFKNDFPNEKIHFYVLDVEDKTDALREFTTEHHIDMIGFIAHKTNIFQNLFSPKIHKRDFFKLELPMLALHE